MTETPEAMTLNECRKKIEDKYKLVKDALSMLPTTDNIYHVEAAELYKQSFRDSLIKKIEDRKRMLVISKGSQECGVFERGKYRAAIHELDLILTLIKQS
jgi:hypothetical protein